MSSINSENINDIILVRDVLLQGVLKYNRTVSKSEVRFGQRGQYAHIAFSNKSGLDRNTVDDVQSWASEELGRRVYVDPQYIPNCAAVFRIKVRS